MLPSFPRWTTFETLIIAQDVLTNDTEVARVLEEPLWVDALGDLEEDADPGTPEGTESGKLNFRALDT